MLVALVVLGSLLSLPFQAFAHHGYAAYDMTKVVVLKGAVTRFVMQNPHSVIEFDAKDENGNQQHWIAETGHLRSMKASGWQKTSLKPGDVVEFHFHPAKNGSHVGDPVKVVFPDGSVLPHKSSS
jgi:hypothetical protein